MSDMRIGEEILLDIPGVLYTESTEDVVAFSDITVFGGIATAHARGKDTLLRADKVIEDEKTERLSIISRNTRYDTREFTDEDGLWLSRYQIDLPVEALAGLTLEGNAENMDTPETLTGYLEGGFLTGIIYENNGGTWLRTDNSWLPVDETDTVLSEGSTTFEVDPERAAELLELFDGQHVNEEEARAFSIEGA